MMANLIREDDTAVYGDKVYASDEKKRAAQAAGVVWAVKEKANIAKNGAQVFVLLALANLYLARGRIASA